MDPLSESAYESVTSALQVPERHAESLRLVHAGAPSAPELSRAVDEVLPRIQAAADAYVQRQAATDRTGTDAPGDAARLWASVGDQVGGKLLRPRLAATAYLGLGGRDTSAIVPVAAAHELLHTAMLIHDDLIDHDSVRRGRPNVAGTYRAGEVEGAPAVAADAAALLGGDLAMWGAVDLVLDANLAPAVQAFVLRLLVRSVHTTIRGELLDVLGQYRAPGEVDARTVALLKTAVYSSVLPLVTGAQLAGADATTCEQLERYGRAAGVAFQLVDDMLGTFGDPAVTGKSALSDLREGKRTELVAVAWRRADAEQSAVLRRHLGDPDLEESGAAAVRAVLHATGAVDAVAGDVRALSAEAAASLTDDLPQGLRVQLGAMLDKLVERAE
ncbi:geranylgeranyl diphosphate synthase, type II [Paraoerskovia marina]|uniref:Geranylgeranyl diphosphate synthase, type II n=1 Tax=Paraoerskovia marina TaxID=545619 RepID=A0A1H1W3N3_9CELL|nr:geranylgeranyl diphosphate synthase, type II [Paraoerskovia marina]